MPDQTVTYRARKRCFIGGALREPGATFEAEPGLTGSAFELVEAPAPKPAKGAKGAAG